MITEIGVENFKGIGEPGIKLDLEPVTLLFGSNSAGKSTIFHAFLYAYEVLVNGNRNPDVTDLGGHSVDLGGFSTFVHRHELSRAIGLEFCIDLRSERLDYEFPMDELLIGYEEQLDVATLTDEVWDARVKFDVRWDFDRARPYISGYSIGINNADLAMVKFDSETSDECKLEININHPLFILLEATKHETVGVLDLLYPELRTEFEKAYFDGEIVDDDYLKSSEEEIVLLSSGRRIDVPWEVRTVYCYAADGREFIARLQRTSLGIEVREFRFLRANQWESKEEAEKYAAEQERFWSNKRPPVRVKTQLDALPNWERLLDLELLPYNSTDKNELADEDKTREYRVAFVTLISRLVVAPGRILARTLAQSRYIGPLREIPQREHKAPLSPDASRWSSGIAAWDLLCGSSGAFLETVSNWLSSSERLGTGYSLIRKRFKELDCDGYIMRLLQQESPLDDIQLAIEEIERLPEQERLKLRDDESLVEVEPQDIAVGITQLIPVLVSALDRHEGITLIEQPELHNHPAVEVGLGDLFVETIRQRHCRFILETHGEHLLLRILKRVRQTTERELPEGIKGLLPNEVAVYHVERTASGVNVKRLRVDESGEFVDRWPKGFFEERAKELF